MTIDDFDGRVAFLTGGAQGIGLAIARMLVGLGVKVAIADVNDDRLAAAAEELAPFGDIVTARLDVRDREAWATAADHAETRLGPVSLLFNNAGVAGFVSPPAMTFEMWDWVIGVNLHGVINGVQTFVPRMIGRGGDGYVVNTASGAGLVATQSGFLYTTSKFAVVGMSESLHLELAPYRIGVSVLCPGPVATDIVANTVGLRPDGERPSKQMTAALDAATAMLAAGTSPDAVAQMVLDAMRSGRLHIHTDDIVGKLIERRTQTLLDALPSRLTARPAGDDVRSR